MALEDLAQHTDSLADEYLTPNSGFEEYRQYLKKSAQFNLEQFSPNVPIVKLLKSRSYSIDKLLIHLWHQQLGEFVNKLSLVAVGGYGRAELHPHSDIDLLILMPTRISGYEESIQMFITTLWDSGLEIGHSVRTVKECKTLAKDDITIATNIMEARPLTGDETLYTKMKISTGPEKIWSGKKFFEAKQEEQKIRHLNFQKTSYSLEPNIKKSPGTLRDIQLVGWVAKRHFKVNTLLPLIKLGFLTITEYEMLKKAEGFLWMVRYALHIVAGRAEDRLLFDHQKPVAEMLGLTDGQHLNDVEQLMKHYYRTVKTIRELNDMLLQDFSETILGNDADQKVVVLDDNFQIHGKQIEIRHDNVFRNDPSCLLELFLHLADHPSLEGVRASTLRRIMIDRELINNDEFRSQRRNKDLFIALFRHPHGIGKPLLLMKRYGVLKAYLPSYARILGQMQYDLFHIYTVDEHTMFVLDNLAKFSEPEGEEIFPLCHHVISKMEKTDVLYLSALFHDIGKGQGGDHSTLGADEALSFCHLHHLENKDAEMVAWLVRNHLIMSRTAQRKDITDPEVINQFAQIMKTTEHLDHLYLLTVADIRATSPNLWNNWKDSLLQNLYQLTYQALDRGLENPKNTDEAIDDVKHQVKKLLNAKHITTNSIEKLWANYKDDYFIRNSVGRIVWQTRKIINHEKSGPLISQYRHPDTGATEVFVYMPKHANYFTLITTLLYEKNLSIQDASLHSTLDGFILGSFVILETDGQPVNSERRIHSIKNILSKNLRKPGNKTKQSKRKMPHRFKHFKIKTKVKFSLSDNGDRTYMELESLDRPGLLSRIGQAFLDLNVELHSAKVVTLGEKVEDIFSITNSDEKPLETLDEQDELRQLIIRYIES